MKGNYLYILFICLFIVLPLYACQSEIIKESVAPVPEEPKEPERRIFIITPDKNNRAYIRNDELTSYLPGDTIYLRGEFTNIAIDGIEGTAEQPIRISNYPGENLLISNPAWSGGGYSQGLHIVYSHHLIIGGESDPDDFTIEGSVVEGSRSAFFCVNIKNFTDNIEVKNITIRDGGIGIMAKTDPETDDPETWYPNTTLRNLSIHDVHITDTYGEAMYIGHTAKKWGWDENGKGYNATDSKEEKPGHTYILPVMWENVEIYNIKVENAGWDAIQCSAVHRLHVYNNVVKNWGNSNIYAQCAGLINGGRNTDTDFHDNLLFEGSGEAIQFFGDKGSIHRIYNNLIVDGRSTAIAVYDNGGPEITNNTIVNAGRYAINVNARNKEDPETVKVYNNVFIETLQIDREPWEKDFYFRTENNGIIEDIDNKKFEKIEDAMVDPDNYYQALAGSPIGNAGYRKN